MIRVKYWEVCSTITSFLTNQKENNLFAHLLEVSKEGIQKLASSQ